MNDVQIIRTASGEELVVLPKKDYDALVAAAMDADEDAADIDMYDARKSALGATDDLLPAEVSDLMLRGQTRLKAIRTWRGVAQREVAEKAGLAQGYVSDLENGRKSGSAETLTVLARLLDVPAKWLV